MGAAEIKSPKKSALPSASAKTTLNKQAVGQQQPPGIQPRAATTSVKKAPSVAEKSVRVKDAAAIPAKKVEASAASKATAKKPSVALSGLKPSGKIGTMAVGTSPDQSTGPAARPRVGNKAPPSRAELSDNNASAGLEDKIHRTAVSKATEVATKTPKNSSATPADGALLSEAALLKMGDKEYMNEAQLAFFKARLQQLEKDLLKNAGETTEHLRETVLVPDPADRATIEEEHALELRTRDRERKLLKKVQQSIASIDGGDYGWCEETGEPIGIPRLLARPTATLSLEAQQRRELKQKLYGD